MKLVQQNNPVGMELCNDNIAETGEMSECISVVIVTENNHLYGVHCGGGIGDDWVDTIVESMKKTKEKTTSVMAIFGFSYQNDVERKYLPPKIDMVKKIASRLNTNACVVTSSSNATIKLTNGQIEPIKDLKIWTSNGWV